MCIPGSSISLSPHIYIYICVCVCVCVSRIKVFLSLFFRYLGSTCTAVSPVTCGVTGVVMNPFLYNYTTGWWCIVILDIHTSSKCFSPIKNGWDEIFKKRKLLGVAVSIAARIDRSDQMVGFFPISYPTSTQANPWRTHTQHTKRVL